MLYLIHGNDEIKAQNQFHKLVGSVHNKKPDTPVFGVVGEEADFGQLAEIVFGNSLFESKYIITLKHFLDNKESEDFLVENLEVLAQSPHIVFVLEKSLTKPILSKFKKYAKDIKEYSKVENEKKDNFIFSLPDALGARDRQKLWVLYQEAVQVRNIPPEEIFWRFVGQVKNMLIVAQASDVRKINMKPFVLQKTNQAAKNFTLEELKQMSADFIKMYDDARNGRREFGVMLERLCLGV